MNNLMHIGLANAATVSILAIPAYAMSRWGKRPAVAHFLWVIILIKLLTPPLWHIPVNWTDSTSRTVATAPTNETIPPADPVHLPVSEPTNQLSSLEQQPIEHLPPAVIAAVVPFQPPPVFEDAVTTATAVPVATNASWRSLVAALWIAGSLVIALLTLLRTLAFGRCLGRLRPAPSHIQELIQSLSRKLGLRSTPVLSVAPMRMPPLVWGRGRRARIIVPARLWEELDREQRATLLVHELAHLRRGDQWVRLLETLARTVYWWHPVVWIASHELREAEEQCCDAWAVWALPGAAKSYARALVDTVDFLTQQVKPLPAGASGIGQVQDLKRRLIMIMRGTTPRKLSPLTVAGLVILGGAAVAFSPGFGQQDAAAETMVADDPFHVVKAVSADEQDTRAEIARLRQQEANLRQAMEALTRSLDQTRNQLRDIQGDQPRATRTPSAPRGRRIDPAKPDLDPVAPDAPVPPAAARAKTPVSRGQRVDPAVPDLDPVAPDAPVPPAAVRAKSRDPFSAPQAVPSPRVEPVAASRVPPSPMRPRLNNANPADAAPHQRATGEGPVEVRLGRLEEQMGHIANAIEGLRRDMSRERPERRPGRPSSGAPVDSDLAPQPVPSMPGVPPVSVPVRPRRPAALVPPAAIAPPALIPSGGVPLPSRGEDGVPSTPPTPPAWPPIREEVPATLAPPSRDAVPARPSPASQPLPPLRREAPPADEIPGGIGR